MKQTRFTLRQLEYLVAVGRFGSISLAADHLSVSPPSISNAIAQLEAEFGLPMFVRKHAQGVALTQSGRALMGQAAQVLEQAKGLSSLADLHKGTVRCELNDQRQTMLLKTAWQDSGNVYGYRKLHDDLCNLGEDISPNRAWRLARLAGIRDLHRFRSGLLRAILAIKETGYGSDAQRRVQAGCGSHRADKRPDQTSGCV